MKEKFNNMSKDFKEDFEFNAGGFMMEELA